MGTMEWTDGESRRIHQDEDTNVPRSAGGVRSQQRQKSITAGEFRGSPSWHGVATIIPASPKNKSRRAFHHGFKVQAAGKTAICGLTHIVRHASTSGTFNGPSDRLGVSGSALR